MKIKKYEQSGFVIDSEKGFRIAIDIGKYTPLENVPEIVAEKSIDAFIVSHIHGDHFSPSHIEALSSKVVYMNSECRESVEGQSVKLPIEIIKAGDKKEVGPFIVTVFSVDHGPNVSAPLKENFGFLIEEGNEKTYFAGDVFYAPDASDQPEEGKYYVDQLEVDTLLLPVGTFYTFGPFEALEFAKQFKKVGKIIPMHYEKTPETKIEFEKMSGGEFLCD